MAGATLTRVRLAGGVWEGWLTGRAEPPRLRLRHRDELLEEPEARPADRPGAWVVRFRLPPERLSDGAQIFVVEDARTGEALAHETIVAGDDAACDVRAEVEILKAELDLLKRAFRLHCAETGRGL